METIGFILLVIFVGIPVSIFLFRAILMTFSSAMYTAVAEDGEGKVQGIIYNCFWDCLCGRCYSYIDVYFLNLKCYNPCIKFKIKGIICRL